MPDRVRPEGRRDRGRGGVCSGSNKRSSVNQRCGLNLFRRRLWEVGRIERSLFMIEWTTDPYVRPALRRGHQNSIRVLTPKVQRLKKYESQDQRSDYG